MDDLNRYAGVFNGIEPWSGRIPDGFIVDFMGTLTRKDFLAWGHHPAFVDGAEITLSLPRLKEGQNGEFWFEAADWVMAAREARDRFVMITLGALYGYQAVGSYRTLQRLNPMPAFLVAVAPIPANVEWTRQHFRDNGINPDDHWLIQAAISGNSEPAFFPVGAPGAGAQNCIAANEHAARVGYFEEITAKGNVAEAFRSLILHNSTGLTKDVVPGTPFTAEIKLVSCVTLPEVLAPLDHVDFLEVDIQQSEIAVFPPHMNLLKRKVRRVHLGTHGDDVHATLHNMFAQNGWEIVFSFKPDADHETPLGRFKTNDGILTVLNPNL